MGPHLIALLRDAFDSSAEAFVVKAIAVAAPVALASAAGVFLTLAAYGALSEIIGAPEAALVLAGLFATLALLALLVIRARAAARRRPSASDGRHAR